MINYEKELDDDGVVKQVSKKDIPYRDKPYVEKRKILRQLSIKDEIRNYLDIMTDKIFELLKTNMYLRDFKFIEDIKLYYYIKSLLVDGYLSFEIIYDNEQKNIIDIIPIDSTTIVPFYKKKEGVLKIDGMTQQPFNISYTHQSCRLWTWEEHTYPCEWIQYPDNEKLKRILSKDQVINFSYSSIHDISNISYVEELKESYDKVKRLEGELIYQKLKGDAGISGILLIESREAESRLKFNSKIPISILENECSSTNDIRYNNFIIRIYNIFSNEMLKKLYTIQNKINKK